MFWPGTHTGKDDLQSLLSLCTNLSYNTTYFSTSLVPPDIHLSGPKQPVREGSNVNLNCSIEGDPKPEIHWFKNGSSLDEQNTVLLLTKVNAADEGKYTCKAENEGGLAEDSIYVTVDSKS